jgi:hypothetical protein
MHSSSAHKKRDSAKLQTNLETVGNCQWKVPVDLAATLKNFNINWNHIVKTDLKLENPNSNKFD